MEKRKYRPSNGTEGELFIEEYCSQCIHEKFMHTHNKDDLKCGILDRTFLHDTDEPEYPTEWVYNENNFPTCTNFQKWDWGNDEDGWNDPPEPEPYNPRQLVMPFILELMPVVECSPIDQLKDLA